MLVLLPPSETKRSGGEGAPMNFGRFQFSGLNEHRGVVTNALVALSDDPLEAARVLRLSERQADQVSVNAALWTSPTMPAIERYTGVLYDALNVTAMDPPARAWVSAHVAIHSAPFGVIAADDAIAEYRLGAGIRVPGVPPMKRFWASDTTTALRDAQPSFVLDLRSEAYAALGPVPDELDGAFLRVVTRTASGATRALNHFNKHAKGALVRKLAETGANVRSADDFAAWCAAHKVELIRDETEWMLVTE